MENGTLDVRHVAGPPGPKAGFPGPLAAQAPPKPDFGLQPSIEPSKQPNGG